MKLGSMQNQAFFLGAVVDKGLQEEDSSESVQLRPFKPQVPAGEMFDEYGEQLFQVRMLRKSGTDFRLWPGWAQRIDCAARLVQTHWRERVREKYHGGLASFLEGTAGPCSGPAMIKTEWGWKAVNDPWAELRAEVLNRVASRKSMKVLDTETSSQTQRGLESDSEDESGEDSDGTGSDDEYGEDSDGTGSEDEGGSGRLRSRAARRGGSQGARGRASAGAGGSTNRSSRAASRGDTSIASPSSRGLDKHKYPAWNPSNAKSGLHDSPRNDTSGALYGRSMSSARSKKNLHSHSVMGDGGLYGSEGGLEGWNGVGGNSSNGSKNPREQMNWDAVSRRRQVHGRASVTDTSGESSTLKLGFGVAELSYEFSTDSSRKLAGLCQGVLGARHEYYKWKNRYFKPVLGPKRVTSTSSAFSVSKFIKWTSVMQLRMIGLIGDQNSAGTESTKPHLQALAAKMKGLGINKDFHAAMSIFNELSQRVDKGETVSKKLAEEVEYWLGRLLDDFNSLLSEERQADVDWPETKWGVNPGEIKQDLAVPKWLEARPADNDIPFLIVKAFPGLGAKLDQAAQSSGDDAAQPNIASGVSPAPHSRANDTDKDRGEAQIRNGGDAMDAPTGDVDESKTGDLCKDFSPNHRSISAPNGAATGPASAVYRGRAPKQRNPRPGPTAFEKAMMKKRADQSDNGSLIKSELSSVTSCGDGGHSLKPGRRESLPKRHLTSVLDKPSIQPEWQNKFASLETGVSRSNAAVSDASTGPEGIIRHFQKHIVKARVAPLGITAPSHSSPRHANAPNAVLPAKSENAVSSSGAGTTDAAAVPAAPSPRTGATAAPPDKPPTPPKSRFAPARGTDTVASGSLAASQPSQASETVPSPLEQPLHAEGPLLPAISEQQAAVDGSWKGGVRINRSNFKERPKHSARSRAPTHSISPWSTGSPSPVSVLTEKPATWWHPRSRFG